MTPQKHQKVQLSLRLRTSPPHSVSIHDACPSEPLKLVVSIQQSASPFPDRAVTVLTKYSCLDTTPSEDAFFHRTMASPQITPPDASCPAQELPLRPVARRITTTRVSGDPDLLKREEGHGFTFVTIPPMGQGSAEVVFELPPSRLVQRLGDEDESVQDKLLRFLRVGDTYGIAPGSFSINWWAFGSLEDEEGSTTTKVARWTLPDSLSLARGPGEDETEEVARGLRDLVDLHDVNHLSSRSAVDGEQRPAIREMRSDGWVFGEPEAGLAMAADEAEKEAVFTITE